MGGVGGPYGLHADQDLDDHCLSGPYVCLGCGGCYTDWFICQCHTPGREPCVHEGAYLY